MKDYDPLTPDEVNDAAKEFFPLFDIVHRNMPENCTCLLYTSPSPRDGLLSRMPSSA